MCTYYFPLDEDQMKTNFLCVYTNHISSDEDQIKIC